MQTPGGLSWSPEPRGHCFPPILKAEQLQQRHGLKYNNLIEICLIWFGFSLGVPLPTLQAQTPVQTGACFKYIPQELFLPVLPQPLPLESKVHPHTLEWIKSHKVLEISCHISADFSQGLDPQCSLKGLAVLVRL